MVGSLNYDQRISLLKDWFAKDILTRFNMPRDLDPKIVAMDIIEAVNRNIPNQVDQQRMQHLVASTAKEVVQSATTRTVPSVKEFTTAIRKVSQSHGERHTGAVGVSFDLYHLAAKRIRSGEAVSDMFLRGVHRQKLIDDFGITEAELDPYDLALAAYTQ
jgi:hypothetical protein